MSRSVQPFHRNTSASPLTNQRHQSCRASHAYQRADDGVNGQWRIQDFCKGDAVLPFSLPSLPSFIPLPSYPLQSRSPFPSFLPLSLSIPSLPFTPLPFPSRPSPPFPFSIQIGDLEECCEIKERLTRNAGSVILPCTDKWGFASPATVTGLAGLIWSDITNCPTPPGTR